MRSDPMAEGKKSSPCRSCHHFGTPPSVCIDYDDCPLNHKQSISSMQNKPVNKRGRGKKQIARDLEIVKLYNDGLSQSEVGRRFYLKTNTVTQVICRAKVRGEFVRHGKYQGKQKDNINDRSQHKQAHRHGTKTIRNGHRIGENQKTCV